MRRVELSMTEEFKYNVIKKLVETKGNKKTAELKLGCTRRTINRMIKGYEQEGKAFFIHGNKGRTPANAVPRWFDRIGTSTVFENLAASCLQGFFSLFLCAFWYGNV